MMVAFMEYRRVGQFLVAITADPRCDRCLGDVHTAVRSLRPGQARRKTDTLGGKSAPHTPKQGLTGDLEG